MAKTTASVVAYVKLWTRFANSTKWMADPRMRSRSQHAVSGISFRNQVSTQSICGSVALVLNLMQPTCHTAMLAWIEVVIRYAVAPRAARTFSPNEAHKVATETCRLLWWVHVCDGLAHCTAVPCPQAVASRRQAVVLPITRQRWLWWRAGRAPRRYPFSSQAIHKQANQPKIWLYTLYSLIIFCQTQAVGTCHDTPALYHRGSDTRACMNTQQDHHGMSGDQQSEWLQHTAMLQQAAASASSHQTCSWETCHLAHVQLPTCPLTVLTKPIESSIFLCLMCQD